MSIHKIGLGLAALGRPGYINLGHHADLPDHKGQEEMEKHSHQILDRAWEAGITYYDAARSYGQAEVFLASWLQSRNILPGNVRVGSKWGYEYTANWEIQAEKHEVKNHSLALLQKQWPESQANLGDYLKLYQIHSATLESGVLDKLEVLTYLGQLKKQGVKIGLSLSGPQQGQTLLKALSVRVQGSPLFDTVQATWNLLEPSAGPTLQEAKSQGLHVILKETLANGRLSPRGKERLSPERYSRLVEMAQKYQVGIDALAVAATLATPFSDTVLLGVASQEHLHSNLQALSISLQEKDLEQFQDFAEPPETYWQTRKNLEWN